MHPKTEIGRSLRALENQTEIPACHTPSKNRGAGESSAYTVDILGLALEQKANAELKAARFGLQV